MKINMEYLTKQLGAIVLLAGLIVLVFGFFVIKPQLVMIKETKAKIIVDDTKTQAYTDKERGLKALEADLATYSDSVTTLDQAMPKENNSAELITILDELAAQNGVIITNLSPTKTMTEAVIAGQTISLKKPYETASYSMTISGDFNSFDSSFSDPAINIVGMLASMEKAVRTLNVKSVRVSGGGEQIKGNPAPV
jgi:Tfp pilus assembly protein PilO